MDRFWEMIGRKIDYGEKLEKQMLKDFNSLPKERQESILNELSKIIKPSDQEIQNCRSVKEKEN